MASILYHFIEVGTIVRNRRKLNQWLRLCVKEEGKNTEDLSIIFCNDNYLLSINNIYLKHDYYTDIITFDHSEAADIISGDIFISVERLIENATNFASSNDMELCRLLIHGALHLCGYEDQKNVDKENMTKRENHHLQKLGDVPRGTFITI